MIYPKPIPEVDNWSRPFFEAARSGILIAQRCGETCKFFFPPAPVSPFSRAPNWSWEQLSGKGTIASFVVMHQKYFAEFADSIPYSVIEVELDEGVRLISNFATGLDSSPCVGMRVEVVFEEINAEFGVPLFKPLVEGVNEAWRSALMDFAP